MAEALCILPFFFPFSAWGLFVGCIAANILSPYPLDIAVGTLANLLAALCTALLGRTGSRRTPVKILACAMPVIFNAVFIGALIAYYTVSGGEAAAFLPAFITSGLQVGLGELAVMYALGLPLMIFLPKTKFFSGLLHKYQKE